MATELEAPPRRPQIPSRAIEPAPGCYDRSSITRDAMVTIHGQSVEEWAQSAPDNQICEYIDGVVYMPSGPTEQHQDVVGFLSSLLTMLRSRLRVGPVRSGPGSLQLGGERYPQPDIFVVPPLGGEGGPPALLVVEILSPSTRRHDLVTKSSIFREALIPDLWFVDMDRRVLKSERFVHGRYEVLEQADGIVSPSSIPGFWLDVAWLWEQPLPDPRLILDRIAAGSPT